MKRYIEDEDVDEYRIFSSKNLKWLGICLAVAGVLLLAIFIAFAGIKHTFKVEKDDFKPIMNFTYTSKAKRGNLGMDGSEWFEVNADEGFDIPSKNEYVMIRTTVKPEKKYNTFCIKTMNNVLSIKKNGEPVFDTMANENSFSGSRYSVLKFDEYGENVNLEIIVYAPLLFDFKAFMINDGDIKTCVAPLPFFDIFIAAIFILSGAILGWILFVKSKTKKRIIKVSYYLSAIAILLGITVFVNPIYTYSGIENVMMFKLSMTINVLLSGLVLLYAILSKTKLNNFVEGICGINIIYAISIMLSPYDVLFIILLKMYIVMEAINLFAYIYVMIKYNKTDLNPMLEGVFLGTFVCNFIYWYGISERLCFDFQFEMLTMIFVFVVVNSLHMLLNRKIMPFGIEEYIGKKLPKETAFKNNNGQIDAEKVAEVLDEVDYNDYYDSGVVFGSLYGKTDFIKNINELLSNKLTSELPHTLHVAEYTRIICRGFGMSEENSMKIAKAAFLHDIGKMSIPYDILTKHEALSEDEFKQIRQHARLGYNFLSGTGDKFLDLAAKIANEHHERYDGSGYLGLVGEQISLGARIVAVADVFDAVTIKRSYKESWSFDKAFSYICEHSGDFFDEDIIKIFKRSKDEIIKVYEAYQEME